MNVAVQLIKLIKIMLLFESKLAISFLKETEVVTWHIVHNHVQVFVILKGKVKLHNPLGVGMSHNVPFLPEKS